MATEYGIANFITAKNISSCLESISKKEISDEVFTLMREKNYDIFGVHDESENIIGYITKEETINKFYIQEIQLNRIVSSDTQLATIYQKMLDTNFLFVLKGDKISDIITLADLTKQPARAYVYMIISSLESTMTQIIKESYSEDSISDILTEGRVNKAKDIYNERIRLNTDIDLFDCLELSDKSKLFKNAVKLHDIGFVSGKDYKDFNGKIHRIRNAISHATDYLGIDGRNTIEYIIKTKNLIRRLHDIYAFSG